jgi:hypothetical protein
MIVRNPPLPAPHLTSVSLAAQVVWLFVMALAVASVSWTITQEEVFRELREYAEQQRDNAPQLWKRKFYYLLTCHYCFSHYVAILFLALTRFKLLYQDWRGYLIALFALVWVANLYISIYALLRQDLKKERFVAKAVEHKVKQEIEPQVEIHKPAA